MVLVGIVSDVSHVRNFSRVIKVQYRSSVPNNTILAQTTFDDGTIAKHLSKSIIIPLGS
jgi:hypothetical protein